MNLRITRILFILCLALGLTACQDDLPVKDPVTAEDGEGLPEHVYFKDNQQTHNSVYYAVIHEENIWVKPNTQNGGADKPWQKLELIDSLTDDVQEIAMDDEHILAINSKREVHTMWNALDEIEEFEWQIEWGNFWKGPGTMELPDDFISWDFSVVSPRFDENYTDPAGHHPFLTNAKCSHIIALHADGQRIGLNDPWLANDWSYEIPGPKRGRFQAVNSSASGATTFIINKYGDMFTRIYDFDLGGMNNFILYSYFPQDYGYFLVTQLPTWDWVQQPKINGRITDRISIFKVGKGCFYRTIRVEGIDADGNTGYYEKDINQLNSEDWVFNITNQPLKGTELDNKSEDSSDLTLGYSEDHLYAKSPDLFHNFSAEITNFNCYVTPCELKVHLSSEITLDLTLHTHDRIRLQPRARGLDDDPREIAGAIELPQAILDDLENQDPLVQDFVSQYFLNLRFAEVTLWATTEKVDIIGSTWFFWPWSFKFVE